jgi:hypothetical protein
LQPEKNQVLMMRRVYRPGKRSRKSGAKRSLSSVFLFGVIGVGLFYGGMTWFRSHSKVADVSTSVAAASEKITAAIAPGSVSAAALPERANLVSAFDGQVAGVVNRAGTEKSSDYHVTVYLPGLDPSRESYAAWLLKDGLADVKRMGELSPRADGSWMLDFTADPISGISNGAAYKTVVIMKEPKGSGNAPSGTRMAEASF